MGERITKNRTRFSEYFNQAFLFESAQAARCEVEFRELQNYINNNEIVVSRKGKGDKIYGKLNILPKVSEIFHSKFQKHIDQYPELKHDLIALQISCDLTEQLSSKLKCFELAEVLFNLYKKYDSLFEIDYALQEEQKIFNEKQNITINFQTNLNDWKETLDFIKFLAEITYFLSNSKSTNIFNGNFPHKENISNRFTLNWCSYCFRRIRSKGKYDFVYSKELKAKKKSACLKHSPLINEYQYRKAKKRAKHLSDVDRKYIAQIHNERFFAESSSFLKRNSEMKDSDHTMSKNQWDKEASVWLMRLNELCPNEDISEITNWNEYVKKFHLLLENYEENTSDPKWIEDIYLEAKIWLAVERKT
ncbi:hypothetical protein [Acinetobacter sp. YH12134]|uniref:hypothetical protein n=1 Tax=Acinetobacter sp. YH12134 TaxID=2601118 RepID=UPI0015D41CF1|nr:hypothetical protein [Acinetobacter sp. YH12134]